MGPDDQERSALLSFSRAAVAAILPRGRSDKRVGRLTVTGERTAIHRVRVTDRVQEEPRVGLHLRPAVHSPALTTMVRALQRTVGNQAVLRLLAGRENGQAGGIIIQRKGGANTRLGLTLNYLDNVDKETADRYREALENELPANVKRQIGQGISLGMGGPKGKNARHAERARLLGILITDAMNQHWRGKVTGDPRKVGTKKHEMDRDYWAKTQKGIPLEQDVPNG